MALEAPKKLTDTPATPPTSAVIVFHDRKLTVKIPNLEQFHALQRIMERVEKGKVDDWTGPQAMKMLDRMRVMIDSVLTDLDDIEWLDDRMLEGTMDIQEAMRIVLEAVKAFNPEKAQEIDQAVQAELVK